MGSFTSRSGYGYECFHFVSSAGGRGSTSKGRVYDRIRHYHLLGDFPIMQSRQHQLPNECNVFFVTVSRGHQYAGTASLIVKTPRWNHGSRAPLSSPKDRQPPSRPEMHTCIMGQRAPDAVCSAACRQGDLDAMPLARITKADGVGQTPAEISRHSTYNVLCISDTPEGFLFRTLKVHRRDLYMQGLWGGLMAAENRTWVVGKRPVGLYSLSNREWTAVVGSPTWSGRYRYKTDKGRNQQGGSSMSVSTGTSVRLPMQVISLDPPSPSPLSRFTGSSAA